MLRGRMFGGGGRKGETLGGNEENIATRARRHISMYGSPLCRTTRSESVETTYATG